MTGIITRIAAAASAFKSGHATIATRALDAAAGGRRWENDRSAGFNASALHGNASTIAIRAAHFAANTPEGRRISDTLTANLIGAGIVPRPKHTAKAVRGALLDQWNALATDIDADGRTDIYGIQAAAVADMVTHGEALFTILSDPETGAPKLRRLHPDQLDRTKTMMIDNRRRIVDGVEFDANGNRVAYWVRPHIPGDPTAAGMTAFAPVRMPAASIIHMFRSIMPGQVRGLSWFAPVLLQAAELDALFDAELVRVKTAAMFIGSLSDPNGEAGGFDGAQNGNVMDTTAEPGTIRVEKPGESLNWNDPPDAGNTDAFKRSILRRIATGTGATYTQVSGDYSQANYSSERAAQLEFRRFAEQIQWTVIIPQLCRPVWTAFVQWLVLSGRISAAAYQSNPTAFEAEHMPQAWPWVDPAKDAKAVISEIDAGIRSRAQVVAERGYDVEEIDAQRAADLERENALGLPPRVANSDTETPDNGAANERA